jgi:hypothetical protein
MVPKSLTRPNPYELSQQYVDIEASKKWMTSADLFTETEGFLTEIQDQVILTRNYKKYILKQPNTDELCRRCGKESKTIQHITAACEQLAPTEYSKRRDGVGKVIHQKLTEAAELIEDKSPYSKYTPGNVLENDKYQELANEMCAMWKQNAAQVIPIGISTGVIPKSLSQNLKRLNLHPNTYIEMQKSVILDTCSIVRTFLNYK